MPKFGFGWVIVVGAVGYLWWRSRQPAPAVPTTLPGPDWRFGGGLPKTGPGQGGPIGSGFGGPIAPTSAPPFWQDAQTQTELFPRAGGLGTATSNIQAFSMAGVDLQRRFGESAQMSGGKYTSLGDGRVLMPFTVRVGSWQASPMYSYDPKSGQVVRES